MRHPIVSAFGTSLLGTAAACGLAASYFFPPERFGFAPVDFWRYLLPSDAAYYHVPATAALWMWIRSGMHSGQLGPAAFLPLSLWNNPVLRDAVRSCQTLGIVANFGTFYLLVFRLTRSNLSAIFSVAIALGAVELRTQSDPYLSNLIILPFAAELVLIALLVFVMQPRTRGSIGWFSLSALLFLASVAVLPSCAMFALLFVAWAWLEQKRIVAFTQSLAFIAVACIGFLAIDGQPLGSLAAVIPGFLSNLIQTLPLTYRATSGIIGDRLSTTDRDTSFDHVPAIDSMGWIVAFSCAVAVFAYLSAAAKARVSTGCSILGGVLWISASTFPLYGSYFEAFGFAMVCAGLAPVLYRLHPAVARMMPALLGLALFFVVYGNVRANKLVAQMSAQPWEAFVTVQRGAQYDLFSNIPAGAAVALSSRSALQTFAPSRAEQGRLFFSLNRKRFRISKTSGGWLLRERLEQGVSTGAGCGYPSGLYASKTCIVRSPRKVELLHLVSGKGGFQADQAYVYGEFVSRDDAWKFADDVLANVRGISVSFERFNDQRTLLKVTHHCGPAIFDDILRPEHPSYTWSTGFYPLVRPIPVWYPVAGSRIYAERFLKNPAWRYMRRSGEILFSADKCGPATVQVTLLLYSALPGSAVLSGPMPRQHVTVPTAGVSATFEFRLPARGNIPVHLQASTPSYFPDQLIPRIEGNPVTDIHLMVVIDTIRVAAAKGTGK